MGRRAKTSSILTGAILCTVVVSMSITAQPLQVPPSEPLLPFGDSHDWIVTTPLVYIIGNTSDHVDVPAGFVTDLASIPPAFWGPPLNLTPTGQYSRAAIVHDYLYWSQKCTRDQADRLLVIAMKESKVGWLNENAIFDGVHEFGKTAWTNDAKDKARGLPRILPEANRHPPDPNMAWPDYADGLMKAGIQSLNPPDDGHYCKYGDTMDVPGATQPMTRPP